MSAGGSGGPLDGIDGVDVATHPVVVGVAIVAVCVWLLSNAIARAVGPLTEAQQRRRAFRQEVEDARILDLSQQVDHLTARVWTLERQRDREAQQLLAHARWDHEVTVAAISAGVDIPPMPALRPAPED